MKFRILTTATLLALAACSNLALADDPPARVGRVALTQGQVSISTPGTAANAALVNWPVTSNNTISTAPGARTELRVGSSTIRLDGDSALDVVQLDDQTLRLRLHYGSASIRVVNPDHAAGFELSTPQARVLLQQPGRVRVDAERDTSSVRVFEGVASVEAGGERLTVRSGRSAEVQGNDLRTTQAQADDFDAWVAARDRQIDNVLATRYVPQEMTGYEDLDRYGSWQRDSEYGALWLPAVASDWVPYRDGRWTWIAPWGWTWVDNAPWGYAPFHYGRWVHVNRRWAWAPGRLERYPVWAPALVGWVGGAGWSLTVNARPLAAQGWYPLSPYDPFVPGYRLSNDHLRRLNTYHSHRDDGRHERRHDHDYRQRGLTVVPHDRFGQRNEILVPHEPRLTPPPTWHTAPRALPPAPRDWRQHEARRFEDREERDDDDARRGRAWRDGGTEHRRAPVTMPAPVLVTQTPQPAQPATRQEAVRQPGLITTAPPAGSSVRDDVPDSWRERRERDSREAFEERRQRGFAPPQRDDGAASAIIGTPHPAPQPFMSGRGGAAAAMEAANARAQARMPAPATAIVSPPPPPPRSAPIVSPPPPPPPAPAPIVSPPPTAVAAPLRALPTPRTEGNARGRENVQQRDR